MSCMWPVSLKWHRYRTFPFQNKQKKFSKKSATLYAKVNSKKGRGMFEKIKAKIGERAGNENLVQMDALQC